MAEHEHGSMDVSRHEKVFAGFVKWSIWVGGLSIATLLFIALVNG